MTYTTNVYTNPDRIAISFTDPLGFDFELRFFEVAGGSETFAFTWAAQSSQTDDASSAAFMRSLTPDQLASLVLGVTQKLVDLATALNTGS